MTEPKPRITTALFIKPVTVFKNNKKDEILSRFPAKSISVIPYRSNPVEFDKLEREKAIIIGDINTEFKTYQYTEGKKPLFFHLAGGIGDVIAFSAMAEYLKDCSIKLFIQDAHFPIVKWFKSSNVSLNSFFDPIFKDYTQTNKAFRYGQFRHLKMEYSAIDAYSANWYDAMFQCIGLPEAPKGFGRPHLRDAFIERQYGIKERSILIKHRASCQMRSSTLEDFFTPVRRAYPNYSVYCNDFDLTPEDRAFAKAKNIHIIPKTTIAEHLNMLCLFQLVVSTDTGDIHFREGIGLPCVGVFGAMTKYSRTRDYEYTHSFDTHSECDLQPCFIHELVKGAKCPKWKKGDLDIAPCQTGESFQEQLYINLILQKC